MLKYYDNIVWPYKRLKRNLKTDRFSINFTLSDHEVFFKVSLFSLISHHNAETTSTYCYIWRNAVEWRQHGDRASGDQISSLVEEELQRA